MNARSSPFALSSVPVIPGTWQLLEEGIAPGGTHRNLSSVEKSVEWDSEIPFEGKLLLCDAQTSGGLLISLPHQKANEFITRLEQKEILASVVGEVFEPQGSPIQVVQ